MLLQSSSIDGVFVIPTFSRFNKKWVISFIVHFVKQQILCGFNFISSDQCLNEVFGIPYASPCTSPFWDQSTMEKRCWHAAPNVLISSFDVGISDNSLERTGSFSYQPFVGPFIMALEKSVLWKYLVKNLFQNINAIFSKGPTGLLKWFSTNPKLNLLFFTLLSNVINLEAYNECLSRQRERGVSDKVYRGVTWENRTEVVSSHPMVTPSSLSPIYDKSCFKSTIHGTEKPLLTSSELLTSESTSLSFLMDEFSQDPVLEVFRFRMFFMHFISRPISELYHIDTYIKCWKLESLKLLDLLMPFPPSSLEYFFFHDISEDLRLECLKEMLFDGSGAVDFSFGSPTTHLYITPLHCYMTYLLRMLYPEGIKLIYPIISFDLSTGAKSNRWKKKVLPALHFSRHVLEECYIVKGDGKDDLIKWIGAHTGKSCDSDPDIVVCVVGGDTLVHDVLNGYLQSQSNQVQHLPSMAIIPYEAEECGLSASLGIKFPLDGVLALIHSHSVSGDLIHLSITPSGDYSQFHPFSTMELLSFLFISCLSPSSHHSAAKLFSGFGSTNLMPSVMGMFSSAIPCHSCRIRLHLWHDANGTMLMKAAGSNEVICSFPTFSFLPPFLGKENVEELLDGISAATEGNGGMDTLSTISGAAYQDPSRIDREKMGSTSLKINSKFLDLPIPLRCFGLECLFCRRLGLEMADDKGGGAPTSFEEAKRYYITPKNLPTETDIQNRYGEVRDWMDLEGPFAYFIISNLAYNSKGEFLFPTAHISDGNITILSLQSKYCTGQDKKRFFSFMSNIQAGKCLKMTEIHYSKATCAEIHGWNGLFLIDGKSYTFPLDSKMMISPIRGMIRWICN